MLQKFMPGTTLTALACGLLVTLSSITVAAAPDFEPRDMSATALQSRTFEGVDEQQLARATLSVIQDLKFLVTETEAAPLTLVARSPGPRFSQESRTLTVSLRALPTERDGASLRLDLAAVAPAESIWRRPPLDTRADFYQAFFAALADTLHRQGVLP
ncbi:hypothetical protein EYC98_08205 [Halieaceae bacterium IMCC14734]|uniref:DUF3016 domain-containing protein n=1 Tax=Candidatus Litorirhabdus singularis TaxID=2518993 RepID=A0ABT3TGA6_9GAMM|nr:hypothetical protein [Candidatus Litorirhabdus singularis]MCX2980855.1 hypothetical protein [Candidatus Litorirhabdus singularis]